MTKDPRFDAVLDALTRELHDTDYKTCTYLCSEDSDNRTLGTRQRMVHAILRAIDAAVTTEMPKPCGCGAELIGLSDGSSVHGWRCSQCAHEWPRQVTVRGIARFNYVKSGGELSRQYEEWRALHATGG